MESELGTKVRLSIALWIVSLLVIISFNMLMVANGTITSRQELIFISVYSFYLIIPTVVVSIVTWKERNCKLSKDSRLVSKLYRKHTSGNYEEGTKEYQTKQGRKYTVTITKDHISISLEDSFINCYSTSISTLR